MNRLKESGKLPLAALWQLAGAYQLAGKPEIARGLTQSAALTLPHYRELGNTYGSEVRDQAIILETLWAMKDYERGLPVAKDISAALTGADRWLSTQEIAYALVAMARFAGATKGDDVSKVTYTLASGAPKQIESHAAVVQERLAVGHATDADVSVTNRGAKPLFVRLIGSGLPQYGTETDAAHGLNLAVAYKTTGGDEIDPAELDQGTDFVAEVTVKNVSGRMILQNLALSHLVAAGWEIRNQRIEGGAATSQAAFDYQDIRDDRIYTYLDLKPNEAKTFKVMLNASYIGHFYLPLVAIEAMYDGSLNARVKGQWVDVKKAGTPISAE